MSRPSRDYIIRRGVIANDAYLYWLNGHTISDTAECFGMSRDEMSLYIKSERERDNKAAEAGVKIKREFSPVSFESPTRWMSDEEIRRDWRLAADKQRQVAILAQMNGLSPLAIEKIIGGTA